MNSSPPPLPQSATSTPPSPWNVPNLLTTARLILAIVVFALISNDLYLAALVVFVFAAATDWIDGYWARRYGQVPLRPALLRHSR